MCQTFIIPIPNAVELHDSVLDGFGSHRWAGHLGGLDQEPDDDMAESVDSPRMEESVEDPLASLEIILGQLQLLPEIHPQIIQMVTRTVGGPATHRSLLPPVVHAPGAPPEPDNNYFHNLANDYYQAYQAIDPSNVGDNRPLLRAFLDLENSSDITRSIINRNGTRPTQYHIQSSTGLQVLLAKQGFPIFLRMLQQDYFIVSSMNGAGTHIQHILQARPGERILINQDGYPYKCYTIGPLVGDNITTKVSVCLHMVVVTAKLAVKVFRGQEDSLTFHERLYFEGRRYTLILFFPQISNSFSHMTFSTILTILSDRFIDGMPPE